MFTALVFGVAYLKHSKQQQKILNLFPTFAHLLFSFFFQLKLWGFITVYIIRHFGSETVQLMSLWGNTLQMLKSSKQFSNFYFLFFLMEGTIKKILGGWSAIQHLQSPLRIFSLEAMITAVQALNYLHWTKKKPSLILKSHMILYKLKDGKESKFGISHGHVLPIGHGL